MVLHRDEERVPAFGVRIGRIEPEHVVMIEIVEDSVNAGVEVVGVDDRKASGDA